VTGAAEATQPGPGVSGHGQSPARDRSGQASRAEIELVGVVDQEVLEAAAGRGPLAGHPQGQPDQIAVIARARVGQHPLVGPVDLGELTLDRHLRRVDSALLQRRRPADILLDVDQFGLQSIDLADEPAEQRAGTAADVVVLQGQLVDPLDQHRQAVPGGQRRLERPTFPAQDHPGQLPRG
jgi:hypothetical protein